MAILFSNIVPPILVSSSQISQYTVPNSTTTIIDKATVANTSLTTNVSLSVHLVPSGDSPTDDNLLINEIVVECGDTYLLPELVNQVLPVGTEIVTIASVDALLSLRISGRQIT